jgi:hypothetical protein
METKMPNPGQSTRELLDKQSTEKAMSMMDPDSQLTAKEREAKAKAREAFWGSVRKARRPPWK